MLLINREDPKPESTWYFKNATKPNQNTKSSPINLSLYMRITNNINNYVKEKKIKSLTKPMKKSYAMLKRHSHM